ncbi:MAG: hypothetical protein Q9M94_02780 [Candidatus Gracilibacteria bacterium]|nr:hypothetical protein [Candidatus Gracilibacteria bacterium]MDQ7022687.1 hypothetical protein [Candidatus Gracilibacteria bacterium]
MENKKIISEEKVLDRIEQSFELFKNNFLELFLPIFLYTLGTITIFMNISNYFGVKYLNNIFGDMDKNNISENMNWLSYSNEMIIGIYIFVILIVLYLTLYIPFLLATIKGIKQGYNGEKVTAKENVIYGFKNLLNSFRTYWFIFAYVALIPALIGIVGGLLFIYGSFNENSNLELIGGIISVFSLILFIFFSVYRGIKSKFAMNSAIDKNEFIKEHFDFSIEITKTQWWRILGNFLLIGIIISLVSGVFNSIVGLFGGSFDFNINSVLELKENPDPEKIISLVNSTIESYSPITNFIKNTLDNIISTSIIVFTLIFSYILFKRLEIEDTIAESKEEKNIEL